MALNWSLAGDLKLYKRSIFYDKLVDKLGTPPNCELPETNNKITLIDYGVNMKNG